MKPEDHALLQHFRAKAASEPLTEQDIRTYVPVLRQERYAAVQLAAIKKGKKGKKKGEEEQ